MESDHWLGFAVIEMPDSRWGEQPLALLVVNEAYSMMQPSYPLQCETTISFKACIADAS